MKPDREERPDIVFTVLVIVLAVATFASFGYAAWLWWVVKP